MFTRVNMSAVKEVHHGGVPQTKYSEEHGELPLAKNRRICPTKNNMCATTLELTLKDRREYL